MSETSKIEYRARVWEGIDTFDAVAASTAAGSMRDEFLASRTEELQIHDNGVRAVRAADGMIAYARRCGTGTEELPTVFADFLGDAHHLADALGVDSVMPHAMGRGIFAAELYGTE
ncbi:hypothetical protein [Rhodococcus qingshengii]|uniref:hypothetical protein n=1 Tax=Rhodococcus qingshengii TaxID=334542 RepID=UPI0006CF4890|nr:hypothetical protein [Rhodococcus qingshengii]